MEVRRLRKWIALILFSLFAVSEAKYDSTYRDEEESNDDKLIPIPLLKNQNGGEYLDHRIYFLDDISSIKYHPRYSKFSAYFPNDNSYNLDTENSKSNEENSNESPEEEENSNESSSGSNEDSSELLKRTKRRVIGGGGGYRRKKVDGVYYRKHTYKTNKGRQPSKRRKNFLRRNKSSLHRYGGQRRQPIPQRSGPMGSALLFQLYPHLKPKDR